MSSAVAETEIGHRIIRSLRNTLEEADADTTDENFHKVVKTLEEDSDLSDGKLRSVGYELDPDSPIFNYSEKTRETADRLEIPWSTYVNEAALKQPSLFYQKPETIENNIKEVVKRLEVTENEYIQAALKQPQLFHQKPETIIRHANWFYALEREEVIEIPDEYGSPEASPAMDYMTNSPRFFCLANDNFELRLFYAASLEKDSYMKNLIEPKYKVLDELELEHGIAEDWLETEEVDVEQYHTSPENAEIGGLFDRNLAYDQEIVSEYLQELEDREDISSKLRDSGGEGIPERVPDTTEMMSTETNVGARV